MTKLTYIKPQIESFRLPLALNLLGVISNQEVDTTLEPIDFGGNVIDPIDFDQGANVEA